MSMQSFSTFKTHLWHLLHSTPKRRFLPVSRLRFRESWIQRLTGGPATWPLTSIPQSHYGENILLRYPFFETKITREATMKDLLTFEDFFVMFQGCLLTKLYIVDILDEKLDSGSSHLLKKLWGRIFQRDKYLKLRQLRLLCILNLEFYSRLI